MGKKRFEGLQAYEIFCADDSHDTITFSPFIFSPFTVTDVRCVLSSLNASGCVMSCREKKFVMEFREKKIFC